MDTILRKMYCPYLTHSCLVAQSSKTAGNKIPAAMIIYRKKIARLLTFHQNSAIIKLVETSTSLCFNERQNDMIDRYEHFAFATNELNKFLRKLAGEEMKKHGLKSPHAIYFTVLANNAETGLTATQLCELSGRDKADASRMLALMEEKGLVVKKGIHQNLYNGIFTLTEKGLQIAECVKQRAAKAVEIAGKDLTEEARQNFYNALDSIVANLRELSTNGIPE